ncbi:MAG TPA: hypothetical protein DIW23_05960, partial [Anaerolineae bacterium]|nr:hypothetical protein [Anaerolineae bacterium]
MKKKTEQRLKQASDITGKPIDQIRSVQVELDVLRNQGILIDLNISGVSMFTRSATWAEIGIQADVSDPRFTRFTKGQKHLIPETEIRALKSVVTRMRYWLDRLSYDVTGFRPYRWLPYTSYEKWQKQWVELWKEFYAIKRRIIKNLDSYQDWLAEGYKEVAEASWNSICANGYKHVIINGKPMNHNQFVDYVVDSVMSKLPKKEEIAEKLQADYVTALVYSDVDVAKEQAKVDHIRARSKQKEEALSLEISRAAEKSRHESMMHQLEEDERRARIDAMIEAEARHAREQLRAIASPFQEVFSELRKRFSEDVAEMLKSIRKNGFVRGKVAEKGRGLIEMFDLLAVHVLFQQL